jgi:hypothetical protein
MTREARLIPACRRHLPASEGTVRELSLMRWGLVPSREMILQHAVVDSNQRPEAVPFSRKASQVRKTAHEQGR